MIIYKGSEANQVKYTERRINSSDCSMVVGDRDNFLYRKYADILRDRGYRVMKLDCSSEHIEFNPCISYSDLCGTIWGMTEFLIRTKNDFCRTAEKHLLHTVCMYVLESNKEKTGIISVSESSQRNFLFRKRQKVSGQYHLYQKKQSEILWQK